MIKIITRRDSSNEGLIHESRPIFSTQFHPEAKGGPMDTAFLFDVYLESVQRHRASKHLLSSCNDRHAECLLPEPLAKGRVDVRTDSISLAEASPV